MNNIIQFGKTKREPQPGGEIIVSLNKLFLAIQFHVLVTGAKKTARELLEIACRCPLDSDKIQLPARYREAIEETDVEATYKAILKVPE